MSQSLPLMSKVADVALSSKAIPELQKRFGLNRLPELPPPTWYQLLFHQLQSPLVFVLLLASLVTFFLADYADSVIILLAVLVNTLLGFFQEQKASKALFALKHHLPAHSIVLRDKERQEIESENLVPGDLVFLSAGTKVPADGKLLVANRCYFDEAVLTGESLAVEKKEADFVGMGSILASGQAFMQVTAIGSESQMGKIALRIQDVEAETPLQRQLRQFSQLLLWVVVVLTTMTFFLGLLQGTSWVEMFKTSVALAVSSIPEGLLIGLTMVLAIGMQRILKRQGLVKKLASAETLGGITVICSDKTGTLTEGKMKVAQVFGNEKQLARQVCLANDLDDPMLVAAYAWGEVLVGNVVEAFPRLDSLPFSSKNRYFVSLHRWSKQENRLLINGAPEVLLAQSDLSEQERQSVMRKVETLTAEGHRVLAFAQKKVAASQERIPEHFTLRHLEWLGLLAFDDPVRLSVKKALQVAQRAGIKILVITGDFVQTARHVLAELALPVKDEEIITGDELAMLTTEELADKISQLRLFARSSPDQKMKIVAALKAKGEVVAMLGDGVNDAPALHQADIGVVVSEATDVAKESADLILLDSNFSTIVAAIREGRQMFENIRKIILYLINDAFSEIILVMGSILLALPLPLTAMQILWINLISDGLPSLALTIDPSQSNLMSEKPRPSNEPLVNRWMIHLTTFMSLFAGLATLVYFWLTYQTTGDLLLARSVAFISLGLDSLLYVFAIRDFHHPFWKSNFFANPWLIAAVLFGFVMQVVPFLFPVLRDFFQIEMPSWQYWLESLAIASGMFFLAELFKWRFRRYHA